MEDLPIGKAFTLIEPGPVVLVTTNDGHKERGDAVQASERSVGPAPRTGPARL